MQRTQAGIINKYQFMDKLNNEKDLKVLAKWHKLAAKSDSIEEFEEKIKWTK